jgi:hypothetical protein
MDSLPDRGPLGEPAVTHVLDQADDEEAPDGHEEGRTSDYRLVNV